MTIPFTTKFELSTTSSLFQKFIYIALTIFAFVGSLSRADEATSTMRHSHICMVNQQWGFAAISLGHQHGLTAASDIFLIRDGGQVCRFDIVEVHKALTIFNFNRRFQVEMRDKVSVTIPESLPLPLPAPVLVGDTSIPGVDPLIDEVKDHRQFRSIVTHCYPKWGFVVVKGGMKEGLAPKVKLNVYRNRKLVGNLQVTQLEGNNSVATMVSGSLQAIRSGDTVLLANPVDGKRI